MERYHNQQAYDPDAGPWPVQYSEEEIQQQRDAGNDILQRFRDALSREENCFDIPEGVYRINDCFSVDGYQNGLHIRASNVELIMEGGDNRPQHFGFHGSRDIKVTGRLILDANPIGCTQGTIIDRELNMDAPSYLTIRLHPGYGMPDKDYRFLCFNPETGVMLPMYQVVMVDVEDLGDRVVKLKTSDNFFSYYKPECEAATAVGNFVCMENLNERQGGINTSDSTNVEFEDIHIYNYCLIWGLPIYGDHKFVRVCGHRRPGTNRLMGGGFPALQHVGGTCHYEDCEIGHNFDDLTDIGGELSFAWNQVAPNQVYIGSKDRPIEPGRQYTFYNAHTLEKTGEATVTEAVKTEDQGVTDSFWNCLNKDGCLTCDTVPWLVTLDRDLQISELEVLDSIEARPKSMTFINCYLHDCLASGVSLKGADYTLIEGNVIERAGYRGIGVGFDPYWWEGGVPVNVTIVNNHIIDTPMNLPDLTPAVNIYCDASNVLIDDAVGQPMANIKIANNHIRNSKTAAIGVQYAKDIEVLDNVIENPMAARLQTAYSNIVPYSYPSAIYLNAVTNATVKSNRINLEDPSSLPEVITATDKTDKSQIRMESNVVLCPDTEEEELPDIFFTKISASEGSTEGQWDGNDRPECYKNKFQESKEPGAKITFSWRGSRGRIYGILNRSYGRVDIVLDDQYSATVDCSSLPEKFADRIGDAGLAGQLLYDSKYLEGGYHTLTVIITDSSEPNDCVGAGVEAFDFLPEEQLDICLVA